MIRFDIVHKCGSLYTFTQANQGRFHHDTREQALVDENKLRYEWQSAKRYEK